MTIRCFSFLLILSYPWFSVFEREAIAKEAPALGDHQAKVIRMGDGLFIVSTIEGSTVWRLNKETNSYDVLGPQLVMDSYQLTRPDADVLVHHIRPYNGTFHVSTVDFSKDDPRLRILKGLWSDGQRRAPVKDWEKMIKEKSLWMQYKDVILPVKIVTAQNISRDELDLDKLFLPLPGQSVHAKSHLDFLEMLSGSSGNENILGWFFVTAFANSALLISTYHSPWSILLGPTSTVLGMVVAHRVFWTRPAKTILTDRQRMGRSWAYVGSLAAGALASGAACAALLARI